MARNVLDRKTIFSPKRVSRMDDNKAFNEDFDEVIGGIIHKMNNTKKYEKLSLSLKNVSQICSRKQLFPNAC